MHQRVMNPNRFIEIYRMPHVNFASNLKQSGYFLYKFPCYQKGPCVYKVWSTKQINWKNFPCAKWNV